MAKYHVNPITWNAGPCKAFHGACPFGDDSAHYDTVEAAQASVENNNPPLPEPIRKKEKVYRVGSLTAPENHKLEDLNEIVKFFDSATPEGRQGRAGAIFASPDMDSHMRWVKGTSLTRGDMASHELTVDPHSVYVYPIDSYERASLYESTGKKSDLEEARKEYWESGMTLAEWKTWAKTAKPARGSWEVLLPPDAIQSVKPMSNKRIIEAAPEDMAREINWILEPKRASKGLIWRKAKQVYDDTA